MSLKVLELQIAIPKTFDAGKMADNHQQNVVAQQMNAHEALKKEIERKQTAVNETDGLENINEDDGHNSDNLSQSNDQKKKKLIKEKPAKHPFKGNFFDCSG